MKFDMTRRLVAEALGTLILVMAVVGSGIMAEKLGGGNQALALLCNTIATGAVLYVIITIFAPVSGAHFNPVVSLAAALRGELDWRSTFAYVVVQIAGGCVGAVLAHLMFGLDLIQLGSTARTGLGQWTRRIHRHVRADRDHSRLRAVQARGSRDRGRALHHLSLLVHCLDLVRQPCGDHCAEFERYVRRDRAARCAGLYRGRAVRRARRRVSVRLAVR